MMFGVMVDSGHSMLKVICLVDKDNTAIDRLSKGMAPYHKNIDFKILPLHPKRPDQYQIENLKQELVTADLIDAQYYRSIEKLRELIPQSKEIPTLLTHHNPYSITESNWDDYALVIGNNQHIYKELGKITSRPVEYVPNTVDTAFWTYKQEFEPNKNVIMVANRIEAKKGILPAAIAAADLNLHFILVGSVSDPKYMYDIMQCGNVEFHEQISDEALRDLYWQSTVHICNSVDNFESGTLPMLEAMLCGVPVMTRKIGHVPELYNGENLHIYNGDSEDVLRIKDKLLELISNHKLMNDMRDKAWNSAKTRSHERRAYMYQKHYRSVLFPEQAPISIVMPIYNPEGVIDTLNAIANQTYKNIEVIVADDNPRSNEDLIKEFSKFINFPIRYINTSRPDDDYGLARARNIATIEATGDIMAYIDQRMMPSPTALEEMVQRLKPKHWLFGNKGAKKEFVENASMVYRQDAVNAGLFNERLDVYGGLSQELRTRIRNQGMTTEYVPSAVFTPNGKSANRNRKRQEIIKAKNICWKLGLG